MTGEELVGRFRSALNRFFDEAGAFVQSEGREPKPGSIAATERASYSRTESLHTVAGIASLLLESVGEHVTTFVKTITEPVEPLSAWTCVRSILESSSIAAWLLDPLIDVRTRVGRAFAHRYEGMEQYLKLLKALGSPAADLQRLEAHINDAENVAAALGFPRMRNKKGETIAIGQHMPNATEMIKLMLDEERAYRLLSAVAHGHVWAIQQLGFKPAGTAVVGPDGVLLTPFEKHSGTVEGYVFLGIRAAKCMALPLWYQCRYFGWDEARLKALFESVYDEFGAVPDIRFWR